MLEVARESPGRSFRDLSPSLSEPTYHSACRLDAQLEIIVSEGCHGVEGALDSLALGRAHYNLGAVGGQVLAKVDERLSMHGHILLTHRALEARKLAPH